MREQHSVGLAELGSRLNESGTGLPHSKPEGHSTRTIFVCLTQPIPYGPYAGQVLAESEGSGALGQPPTGDGLSLARKYVYGTYIDEPLLLLSALGSGLH